MPGLEALGDKFKDKYTAKYKETMQRGGPMQRVITVEGEERKVIIEYVKKNMDPEECILAYPHGRQNYSLMLVKVPTNVDKTIRYFQRSNNYKVGLLWKDKWISAFMKIEYLDKVKASSLEDGEQYYILVGFLKEKPYTNKQGVEVMGLSTSVYGLISMEEIENYLAGGPESKEVEAKETE